MRGGDGAPRGDPRLHHAGPLAADPPAGGRARLRHDVPAPARPGGATRAVERAADVDAAGRTSHAVLRHRRMEPVDGQLRKRAGSVQSQPHAAARRPAGPPGVGPVRRRANQPRAVPAAARKRRAGLRH
eukprot:3874411-Pyramimonas_sp.AAC.2